VSESYHLAIKAQALSDVDLSDQVGQPGRSAVGRYPY
jgi:hypothetical protein